MTIDSLAKAKNFVGSAQLPAPPRTMRGAASGPSVAFDATKDQAAVVGSELLAFVEGVSAEQRQDVANAVLLAQLVAKRGVPAPAGEADLRAWYAAYFDALSNIGFAIQQSDFTRYQKKGRNLEVHEAILEVAAAMLGAAPAALALVTTTLKALQKMSKDSPWIQLFDRESQSANTARFQISAVESDGHQGFRVSSMAFGLDAKSDVTQVLFFKFRSDDVTLFHQDGRATINEAVLAGVRAPIAAKLTAFANEFIKALPDNLGAPA